MTVEESNAANDRPSSLPTSVSLSLNGFESEEAAQKFGAVLYAYLSAIGRNLDLERLFAVTVAYD
jgi:hypothetical protein